MFCGLATIISERISDAALNPSGALVPSSGLQDALQRVPPASPAPVQGLAPTLLGTDGVHRRTHLILHIGRKQGNNDKSREAKAMTDMHAQEGEWQHYKTP